MTFLTHSRILAAALTATLLLLGIGLCAVTRRKWLSRS